MSTRKSNKINWFFVLVGTLLLISYFFPIESKIDNSELTEKIISLSHDIRKFGSQSGRSSYSLLHTNETTAPFKIDAAGETAASWASLDSLKKGDTLTIKFLSSDENNLSNKAKEIVIYSLQKQDKLFFDTNSYNQTETAQNNRLTWIIIVIGFLFLLNGLRIISTKATCILGGLSFAIIIILRILNKF